MSKGLYSGTLMVGIDQVLFRGKAPWTLHHKHADHETLTPIDRAQPIAYPKPDGVLTFDKLHVGYSLALFQMSTLISVFLGYQYFQERQIRKRLFGSVVMAAGAVLIVMFGSRG